jgi:hypothetical protein
VAQAAHGALRNPGASLSARAEVVRRDHPRSGRPAISPVKVMRWEPSVTEEFCEFASVDQEEAGAKEILQQTSGELSVTIANAESGIRNAVPASARSVPAVGSEAQIPDPTKRIAAAAPARVGPQLGRVRYPERLARP